MKKAEITTLRQELDNLDSVELVDLVADLCSLSDDAIQFVRARMGRPDIDWFKREITRCVRPDLVERENFDFERAKHLIDAFRKATDDSGLVIDLTLHAVEQGNQLTLDYGDIDGDFYCKLEQFFGQSLKLLREHPEVDCEDVRTRINKICDETDGIGWGYHDTLCDLASEFLAEAPAPPSVQDRMQPASEAAIKKFQKELNRDNDRWQF